MSIFLYKNVFNWDKENWCPLDLRKYLEYGRRELGRRGLRRWWLGWISRKSLRSALSMSWEMKKWEWRKPCRFAFLYKASSLDLWSLCLLCVCWSWLRTLQKQLNQSRSRFGIWTYGAQRYVFSQGLKSPMGKGTAERTYRDMPRHAQRLIYLKWLTGVQHMAMRPARHHYQGTTLLVCCFYDHM